MDHYIVSARKYRPMAWDDVVGQNTITSTLQRAIENDHLAQAFLFCGPRGVGKTTCARILAKAINSDDSTDPDEDFSFNIFELDAASNNSVDDIRYLSDQVRFAPQKGNYKVYIIDEVHMLSKAAFNAFLKTLEEPPDHAIFILATTEKQKVIPTILSRCQIFDFKRITIADMVSHLQYVAKSEGVADEEEALHVIAENADGAMRDALSTFARLVTFAGNNLTYKAAIANLNILDHDYYFRTTQQILEGDVPQVLLTFNDVLNNGFNGHDFINGLASHFRDLMVSMVPTTQGLLETSVSVRDRFNKQAANCSMENLVKALKITNEVDVQYRNSKNQRLLVELALMRLCALHAQLSPHVAAPVEKKIPDGKSNLTTASENVKAEKSEAEKHTDPVATEPNNEDGSATDTPASHHKPTIIKEEETAECKETNGTADKAADTEPATEPDGQQPLQKEISDRPIAKRTPLVTPRKRSRAGGMVNISGLGMDKATKDETEEETKPVAADPFSEQEMLAVWLDEVEDHFADRPSLKATLKKSAPKLEEPTVLSVKLENAAQVEAFRQHGTELLDNLRMKLNNYTITLNTPVDKVESTKQAFTSKEKFMKLNKENPDLGNFKDQLGLDLEY